MPGLIEGAADGAGLGVHFLKHLSRTRLLLHLVDVLPPDQSDPVENVRLIETELARFSPELAARERWLVMNKIDLLAEDQVEKYCDDLLARLDWQGPVFRLSAVNGSGVQALVYRVMDYLEQLDEDVSGVSGVRSE